MLSSFDSSINCKESNFSEEKQNLKIILKRNSSLDANFQSSTVTVKRKRGRPKKKLASEISTDLIIDNKNDVHAENKYTLSIDNSKISKTKANNNKVIKIKDKTLKWLQPFKLGWKRELVCRNGSNTKVSMDVYYFTPNGKKLRSYREISLYLSVNEDSLDLDKSCFTFLRKCIYREPFETFRPATRRSRLQNFFCSNKDNTIKKSSQKNRIKLNYGAYKFIQKNCDKSIFPKYDENSPMLNLKRDSFSINNSDIFASNLKNEDSCKTENITKCLSSKCLAVNPNINFPNDNSSLNDLDNTSLCYSPLKIHLSIQSNGSLKCLNPSIENENSCFKIKKRKHNNLRKKSDPNISITTTTVENIVNYGLNLNNSLKSSIESDIQAKSQNYFENLKLQLINHSNAIENKIKDNKIKDSLSSNAFKIKIDPQKLLIKQEDMCKIETNDDDTICLTPTYKNKLSDETSENFQPNENIYTSSISNKIFNLKKLMSFSSSHVKEEIKMFANLSNETKIKNPANIEKLIQIANNYEVMNETIISKENANYKSTISKNHFPKFSIHFLDSKNSSNISFLSNICTSNASVIDNANKVNSIKPIDSIINKFSGQILTLPKCLFEFIDLNHPLTLNFNGTTFIIPTGYFIANEEIVGIYLKANILSIPTKNESENKIVKNVKNDSCKVLNQNNCNNIIGTMADYSDFLPFTKNKTKPCIESKKLEANNLKLSLINSHSYLNQFAQLNNDDYLKVTKSNNNQISDIFVQNEKIGQTINQFIYEKNQNYDSESFITSSNLFKSSINLEEMRAEISTSLLNVLSSTFSSDYLYSKAKIHKDKSIELLQDNKNIITSSCLMNKICSNSEAIDLSQKKKNVYTYNDVNEFCLDLSISTKKLNS